jgi:glycosyltransferase involved in cell wall biosynthesis
MTKLLVDGVFFQHKATGICRVWESLLKILVEDNDLEVFFLDRGNAPEISGINYIPFPSYNFSFCCQDSVLIQGVCDQYKIDVFTSTFFTTPLRTPMLLMVYDMIPEVFNFDTLIERGWTEKEVAISYAKKYICISYSTENDLLKFYPEICRSDVYIAHCGLNRDIFYRRNREECESVLRKIGFKDNFYLFVGERIQHSGYKNSSLFFKAIDQLKSDSARILFVGGSENIEDSIKSRIPSHFEYTHCFLTDTELAAIYSSAKCLIYPSLYEGFGMPVVEAMACGCPVITTENGSLLEAGGDAACYISGHSVDELLSAIKRMEDLDYRRSLISKGLDHSNKFSWIHMANCVKKCLSEITTNNRNGKYAEFFKKFQTIRLLQAQVDYV